MKVFCSELLQITWLVYLRVSNSAMFLRFSIVLVYFLVESSFGRDNRSSTFNPNLFENSDRYCSVCSAISTFEDQLTQKTAENIVVLQIVLILFAIRRKNLVALLGNKCNLNHVISSKVGVFFLCYESHRFKHTEKRNHSREKAATL